MVIPVVISAPATTPSLATSAWGVVPLITSMLVTPTVFSTRAAIPAPALMVLITVIPTATISTLATVPILTMDPMTYVTTFISTLMVALTPGSLLEQLCVRVALSHYIHNIGVVEVDAFGGQVETILLEDISSAFSGRPA